MWVGAIKLKVRTKDSTNAGTDDLITATIVRDGIPFTRLPLDIPFTDDHERGDIGTYPFDINALIPDPFALTSPFSDPPSGIEFYNGLEGHLTIRLETDGDNLWIKDKVNLFIKQNRRKNIDGIVDWRRDADWTEVAVWGDDIKMSTDFFEGVSSKDLIM